MPEALLKYLQLTKVDAGKNLLYGVFSAEVLDKSNEIADYEGTKAAFKLWSDEFSKVSGGKSLGNVRKMHTMEVVGGVKSIDYDDVKKMISGCVEVTPEIAAMAAKGWLNGFSIGGGYAKVWADPVHKGARRFTPVIGELSVVDNPCVPDATFETFKDASFAFVKEDGSEELRKFTLRPEPEVKTMYKAKDGSLHDTLDLALEKNKEIADKDKPADPIEAALKKVEDAIAPEKKEETAETKLAKKISEILELKKGLCDVARIATLIEELNWIGDGLAAEAFMEGDESKNPSKLKDIVKRLAAFLAGLVKEELAEATKAAPEFTLRDVEVLRKVAGAELFKDWTAPVPAPDKAVVELQEKLTKAEADLTAKTTENADLKKKLDDVPGKIEALFEKVNSKIKRLEEQPAAGNQPLFVVDKEKGIGEVRPVTRQSPGDFAKQL